MSNTYRSKFERKIAKELVSKGAKFDYESERHAYTMVLSRHYLVDFVLESGIVIETKGRFTSDDRRKFLCLRAQHPDLDIRLVFMRDNTLSKKSKTKYTDWCEKNGFKCAVGHVPEEWLK